MGNGNPQVVLEDIVETSPASTPVTNKPSLFAEAEEALSRMVRLAESVAGEKGKPVEEIYERIGIGFEPDMFLMQYANPRTHVEVPIRVWYGLAQVIFETNNSKKTLKADEEYVIKKLAKIASEDTRGMTCAGGLGHLFGGREPNDSLDDWIGEGAAETQATGMGRRRGFFSSLIHLLAESKARVNLYGSPFAGLALDGLVVYPVKDPDALGEETERITKEWGGLVKKLLAGAAIAGVIIGGVSLAYHNNMNSQYDGTSTHQNNPYEPSITKSPPPTITAEPTPAITPGPTPTPYVVSTPPLQGPQSAAKVSEYMQSAVDIFDDTRRKEDPNYYGKAMAWRESAVYAVANNDFSDEFMLALYEPMDKHKYDGCYEAKKSRLEGDTITYAEKLRDMPKDDAIANLLDNTETGLNRQRGEGCK
ncbi:hypothetical protein KY347_06865 [Candidatus Woesearchaeota archaeon]|nr:hypothetical protein [Candidatus Woesearchaeota archaeon]